MEIFAAQGAPTVSTTPLENGKILNHKNFHYSSSAGLFEWNHSLPQNNECPLFHLGKWLHTWWHAAG
jgi:hypothetical protein